MTVDLMIKNARIVTPRGVQDGSVAVEGEKIVAIGQLDYLPGAKNTLDAGGRYLIPGAIDLHVHFRDPGMTYKEDFNTGSMASVSLGGVTTVFDMPNTRPSVIDVESFNVKRDIAEKNSYVNFGLYAFLHGGSQDYIEPLIEAGVAGFKWGLSIVSEEWAMPGGYIEVDNNMAMTAFRLVKKHNRIVGVHAEDIKIVQQLIEELKAAGRTDFHAHLESRPDFVEVSAIERVLLLSEITGCRVHIHHLSSKAGLEFIKKRKYEGVHVTSEACPPWFLFSANDYDRKGGLIKVTPAIQEKFDAEALWKGLVDGSIECYATDHAPHSHEEKLERPWQTTLPGAIGVETSMPLMLDKINKGELTIERYVAMACENPARIYGLYPRKGAIEVGADADLVLLDMDKKWTIKNEQVHSKNKLTPFDGWEVQGMPSMVWVNGHLVAKDREVIGQPGFGKLVNAKQQW